MNPSGHPVSPQLHFARVRLGYTRLVRTGGSRLRSIGGARRRHVQSQVPRPATDRTASGPSAPRPGRPSPLPDDHPRFGESGEQQNAEETEHQRRHTSAQNRVGSVGLVNVDVACDPLAIDDAGPVGVPSFQDPRINPTGKSRLAKQIAHDLRMVGPNIGHLPLLYSRSRPRRDLHLRSPETVHHVELIS